MGRRLFSREFKLEAIRLVKERGVSIVQATRIISEAEFTCSDHRVHPSTLRVRYACCNVPTTFGDIGKMLSRRIFLGSASVAATLPATLSAQPLTDVIGETVSVQEFDSPGTRTLTHEQPFGTKRPSDDVIRKVDEVLRGWPAGPRPIDIAQEFIDRYSAADPMFIAQTPKPDPWNPLIVRFFGATSLKVNNDMVDWCAAFVNWCLSRNHKPWTNNAGSQSFINSGKFAETKTPKLGDIVVFTCYDDMGKSLGIGHVGFFKAALDANHIRLIAGNQRDDGHSSIISERTYSTKSSPTTRHINGKAIPCTFKFNQYLSVL